MINGAHMAPAARVGIELARRSVWIFVSEPLDCGHAVCDAIRRTPAKRSAYLNQTACEYRKALAL
jgi:hypothetical protein